MQLLTILVYYKAIITFGDENRQIYQLKSVKLDSNFS